MGNFWLNAQQWLLGVVYKLVYYAPLLIVSITVHEFAHARTAQRLGDDTAAQAGRVSLNPLRHLDPVGSICMLLLGFGWGKPVPISVLNFRNPKRDSALVALAGPVSNLLMACFFGFLYGVLARFLPVNGYFDNLFYIAVTLNCVLCVFNLLPITPLDGSRIFALILPDKCYYWMIRYERWFFLALVVLMFTGVFSPVINFLAGGMYKGIYYTFISLGNWLTSLIAGLF